MKYHKSIFNLKYHTICVMLFIGGIKPLQVLSPAIFFFTFLFSSILLNAQISSEYNINDPRNPECPCHKFQKLAEDEYKKLLARANPNPVLIKKNIVIQEQRVHVDADRETVQFARHQFQNEKNSGIQDHGIANRESDFSDKELAAQSNYTKNKKTAHKKHRHKKRTSHYKKWKRIFDVQHWDVWKEFRDVSSCYHWK